MPDLTNQSLTFKVQIYRCIPGIGGPNPTGAKKHYIYTKAVYDKGGLWANIRDLSQAEIARNTQVDIRNTAELILNYNAKLTANASELWVEFKDSRANINKTYQVNGDADLFDYVTKRIKLHLEERQDNTNYTGGVEYDG